MAGKDRVIVWEDVESLIAPSRGDPPEWETASEIAWRLGKSTRLVRAYLKVAKRMGVLKVGRAHREMLNGVSRLEAVYMIDRALLKRKGKKSAVDQPGRAPWSD